MIKSDTINELATALSKAQSEIIGAVKDSTNPFFKSDYADLASVWEAIRKPLTNHGMSITQLCGEDELGKYLETVILHSSGQWIGSKLYYKPVKDDPQGNGSALTYARRYALAAIAGVSQIDDDAESAMNRKDPEIKTGVVTSVSALAQVSVPEHTCEWLVSKYNPNQLYCPKCKAKKAKAS